MQMGLRTGCRASRAELPTGVGGLSAAGGQLYQRAGGCCGDPGAQRPLQDLSAGHAWVHFAECSLRAPAPSSRCPRFVRAIRVSIHTQRA